MFGYVRDLLSRGLLALTMVSFAIAIIGCHRTPAATAPPKEPAPAHHAKLPTPESGNYKQLCTEKWTKRGVFNSEMYYDCMTHLAEADSTLTDLVTKYSSFPWMQAVVDSASSRWTKRGMRDEGMVAREVWMQIDAYLDIKYASEHSGFRRDALSQCYAEGSSSDDPDWKAPDWTSVLYCYKKATGTD
jgi:hypothetical protein